MDQFDPDEGYMFTGRAVRKLVKAARHTLGQPMNRPQQQGAAARFNPHDIRPILNATGGTLSQSDLVAIEAPSHVHRAGDELFSMVARAVAPSTAYHKLYAIVVGVPVENEDSGLASFSGGRVRYQGTAPEPDKSVGPVSGAHAVSTTGPPYFTVTAVSTADGLCDVVPYQPATISPVTLGAQLPDGNSVTVTLSDGRQVSAENKSGQTLESGNALCLSDPFDGKHYITGSALPSTSGGAPATTGQTWFYGLVNLATDANMEDGFNVDNVVTLDGSTWPATAFQINNPLKLTGGDDDPVLFVESSTARSFSPQGYVAAAILRRQPRWYEAAIVSGGIASTDATGTVESVVALDGAPAPTTTTLTVSNPFNWSGAGGAYCRVVEKLAASSTVDEYILERVEFVKRQVLVASTWNSTSLVHNYINVPLPYTNETGTTVVFNTTQATAVQTVASTGINLVRLDRPLTVFAAGASTQVTIFTGTTCT